MVITHFSGFMKKVQQDKLSSVRLVCPQALHEYIGLFNPHSNWGTVYSLANGENVYTGLTTIEEITLTEERGFTIEDFTNKGYKFMGVNK